jgi:non-heme chloroperoxidase
LNSIDVHVLMLHCDDDQVVPIADYALIGIKLLKHGTLKVYPGYPHGMATTHADEINRDILAFIRGEQVGQPAEAAPVLVAEPLPVG